MPPANTLPVLDHIRGELVAIGYNSQLVKSNYPFLDVLNPNPANNKIPLAAFAQDPPSFETACVGVFIAETTREHDQIQGIQSLGAPLLFGLRETSHTVFIDRWQVSAKAPPVKLETLRADDLPQLFRNHQKAWSPNTVFRAKSWHSKDSPIQYDFIDIGLLPLLEQEAQDRLHHLVERVISLADQQTSQLIPDADERATTVIRFVFRLLAGKVLNDRGAFELSPARLSNPKLVLKRVTDYYGSALSELSVTPELANVLGPVAEEIADAFSFANLSVTSLAYAYENAFVSDEKKSRQPLGIHNTPSYIADYIIHQLPIADIPWDDINVFEPMCGPGTFLVAALRHIRTLLPENWTHQERHRFYANRLNGIEIDPFAREMALLCLMIADYPNTQISPKQGYRMLRASMDGKRPYPV